MNTPFPKVTRQTEAQVLAQDILQAIRDAVRHLCCNVGVPSMLLPMYYCFAFELHRMQRQEISGETLAIEASVALSKWISRGLDAAVLADIRTQVFLIPAPAP